jgi:hypothetical protein
MKKFIWQLTKIQPSAAGFHISLFVFRILVSVELMLGTWTKEDWDWA